MAKSVEGKAIKMMVRRDNKPTRKWGPGYDGLVETCHQAGLTLTAPRTNSPQFP